MIWLRNPQVAVELEICANYGIPRSEFLGWDAIDRDLAIAHFLRKAEECPGCHTRASEWKPAEGGDRRAYYAEIVQCPGCETRERAEEAPEFKIGRGKSVALKKNVSPDGRR